jgi:drug/metabolite transporter (DMT)-like permease
MMTATATVFVLAGLATGRALLPSQIPAEAWLPLVGCGVLSTFLAIQTFYAGSRRIGAAQAALVSTVEPVVIVVLAGLVLGQVLEPIQIVGAGLVLAAVVIAQTSPRPAGAPDPARPLEAEA